MAKVGIAVIGCGDIARARYFPTIARSPEFELRGLYSRKRSVCEPLAHEFGGKVFTDLNQLLGAPAIEAVVIATPHPSHAELSIRSLEAGKHVLSEKPMATSLADARRIEEAAKRAGQVFMALPFDGSPPIEEAKRLIASGAIGRVSSADATLAHRGPKHAPWFFDKGKAEWGVLADLGVYLISQLISLFGPATTVFGRANTVFPERLSETGDTIKVTVDDNVAAVIEWRDHTLATLRANWCSASDHRNVICETRVYGTEGIIFINLASKTNPLIVFSPMREVPAATPVEHNGMSNCYRPALAERDEDREIMRAFADQILRGSGRGDGRNAERQRQVVEIIDKIYASSASGQAVKIGS
jgi:UDP-N-acetylglucosamine 3-dehydrogenase